MPSQSRLSRRDLFIVSAAMTAEILTAPQTAKGAKMGKTPLPEKPPALKPEMVQEFVRVAHGNLEQTKVLLAQEPGLLNASWDWGGGDFELAIGGAGHMGRRDIALFLLEKGARIDVFVAAMLGELEIVRSTLRAFPALLDSKGPHGIPLLAHAKAGGKEAKAVFDYLQSLYKDAPK